MDNDKYSLRTILKSVLMKGKSGEYGTTKPMQYPKYGIFTGSHDPIFITVMMEPGDADNVLSDEEISRLEKGKIDIDDLNLSGFEIEKIERFDFDKNKWVEEANLMKIVSNSAFRF